MTEPRNRDEPVTRRELHEALEIWGARLEDRITEKVTEKVTANVTATLSVEMARQIQASEERMRDFMRALMDPHHGVPERVMGLEARVERLEAKVLAPKRSRRRSSR
jgi:hypothetical protein